MTQPTGEIIGLLDIDPLVYACAFAAQKKRFLVSDCDGPVHDFRVQRVGPKQWHAIEGPKKQEMVLATAYSRAELLKAVEHIEESWTVEEYVDLQPLDHAIQMGKTAISSCIQNTQCTVFQGALSVGDCFRCDIATLQEYKGNRKQNEKPAYYHEMREYFLTQWHVQPVEYYEADDYLATHAWTNPDTTVIASIDKDLLTIPGWHYVNKESVAKEDRLFQVTIYQAMQNFMHQLLTGDRVDNIPGLQGVGDKIAAKILDGKTAIQQWEAVQEEYKQHFGAEFTYTDWRGEEQTTDWEGVLTENGRLLWMVRDPQEPLWNTQFFREVIGDV